MQPRYRLIAFVTAFLIAVMFICSNSCSYLRYREHVKEAKASTLRDTLSVMRKAIKQYKENYGQAPLSLDNLVQTGYLPTIPADPLTNSRKTWLLDWEIQPVSHGRTPGIINVRSGAIGNGPDGTPYSKY